MPLPTTLTPELQARVDELLCERNVLGALVLLCRDAGLQPPPSIHETQDFLHARQRELDRLGRVQPEPPPPTTEQLIAEAAAIPAPIAAIEAYWDGDTQGWHVVLVAVVRRPSSRHPTFDEVRLTIVDGGGDIRLFNDQAPPWSDEQSATAQGQAIAAHFSVPFFFASPDLPVLDPPRWWSVTHPQRL
ncbi:hypothetical protein [Paractinoplanes atraurantiacus]|uniref:Uncharacterized protein n=1 Tax=Paractinoplanes atraurantiacus TaxID=1036182 RepID=A0A285I7Y2_9ACTN|nr:hypothetical protein [Actinoplanes atraurantiacus]SNY44080.1 hypothetical protein SAMN05421748_10726 [Actinoplanes atraurantiacus]